MVNSLKSHLVRFNSDYNSNIPDREPWTFNDYPRKVVDLMMTLY